MTVIVLTLLFSQAELEFNLPKGLLNSLCYIESTHNIRAIHHDDGKTDSIGVCQIKLKTAQSLGFKGNEKQLLEPKTNIYYAAKYLDKQITRYHNNLIKGVIAYNRGNANSLYSTKYSVKVFNRWRDHK